jgi:signal peptidase II
LKKRITDYLFLLSIAGTIILFDQYTKWLVEKNLTFQEIWSPWDWLLPYARIVNWRNTGSAFGMFQNTNTLLMILATLVTIAILYYFPKVTREEKYLRFALSMQMGGAVGNLIDRIRQGYVTDFVSLGTFPVFNVADASISCGVAVLLLGVWILDRQKKKVVSPAISDAADPAEKTAEDQSE